MPTVIIGIMINSFYDQGTEDIYNGIDSKLARKICPKDVWRIACRELDQINKVNFLTELNIPPGNRLECLYGKREGQYSIRINDQFRVCFYWENNNAEQVEITDYHK